MSPFLRGGWWTSGVGRERALGTGGEEFEECDCEAEPEGDNDDEDEGLDGCSGKWVWGFEEEQPMNERMSDWEEKEIKWSNSKPQKCVLPFSPLSNFLVLALVCVFFVRLFVWWGLCFGVCSSENWINALLWDSLIAVRDWFWVLLEDWREGWRERERGGYCVGEEELSRWVGCGGGRSGWNECCYMDLFDEIKWQIIDR